MELGLVGPLALGVGGRRLAEAREELLGLAPARLLLFRRGEQERLLGHGRGGGVGRGGVVSRGGLVYLLRLRPRLGYYGFTRCGLGGDDEGIAIRRHEVRYLHILGPLRCCGHVLRLRRWCGFRFGLVRWLRGDLEIWVARQILCQMSVCER